MMDAVFYISGVIAIVSTVAAVTRTDAIHALLYVIVSFLAIAAAVFALGAPFVAALEVIIYAGAVMVLFVFVVMMLNPGIEGREQERRWLRDRAFLGPSILGAVVVAELAYAVAAGGAGFPPERTMGPKEVALSLLGPYLVGFELASILLLAGLVGAYHLGRRNEASPQRVAEIHGGPSDGRSDSTLDNHAARGREEETLRWP